MTDRLQNPGASARPSGAHGQTSDSDRPVVVFERTEGWAQLNLRELWRSRELLYFLVWRDIKVRYKQTAIGAAWALLQPLLLMLLFTVIFGRVAQISSEGLPYPVFAYAALLPWTFFVTSLNQASRSLVDNKSLLTKVYFPRITLPVAAVVAALVDLAIASTLLAVLLVYYGIAPGLSVLTLPLFTALAAAAALGAASWLAAINVKYRDVQYAVPFLIQLWFFATPIAYSTSLIPDEYQILVALNPMTGVVEGFRWSILGVTGAPGVIMIASSALVLLILVTGLFFFRRMERTFADVV